MLSKLFLLPTDANALVSEMELVKALTEIGMISSAFDLQGKKHFSVGDRFLELIIFLGCSPNIALTVDEVQLGTNTAEGEGYCHLRVWVSGRPILILSPDVASARCNHCKAVIPLNIEDCDISEINCPVCDNLIRVPDLDFRKAGGFGQCFVEIWGIHPHEAVPSDLLLNKLADLTGGAWRYFYTYGAEKIV